MTKKENLEMIMATINTLDVENKDTILEFCNKELENLEKKNASNERRKEHRAEEFAELEKSILQIISDIGFTTPKEISTELGLSTQKIVPRLKALVERGLVVRKQIKKDIFYVTTEEI